MRNGAKKVHRTMITMLWFSLHEFNAQAGNTFISLTPIITPLFFFFFLMETQIAQLPLNSP